MKLENRREYPNNQYVCKLTKKLDSLTGIDKGGYYNFFHHYILADDWCIRERCLAIRVPGRTVGGIWIDNNNIITDVKICEDCIKTYPDSINEIIKMFIGNIIEW